MEAWQLILIDSVLLSLLALTLVLLYMRHRNQQRLHEERMAALEKGAAMPEERAAAPWSPRVYLLRGLIWSFSGAALFVCLLTLAWSSRQTPPTEVTAWKAKSVSETLKIPIDQARQMVERDQEANAQGMPPSVAFLGLIPLAVGLAYLVFYRSDPSRRAGSGTAITE